MAYTKATLINSFLLLLLLLAESRSSCRSDMHNYHYRVLCSRDVTYLVRDTSIVEFVLRAFNNYFLHNGVINCIHSKIECLCLCLCLCLRARARACVRACVVTRVMRAAPTFPVNCSRRGRLPCHQQPEDDHCC